MRKMLPYALILFALVAIVTGFFGYYLKHMSQQLVENWMRIEQLNIQQGNIFSSLATSNRILMSSGAIRSVMLFDVQHNQFSEMASYGEYISVSEMPTLEPGSIRSIFDGPYQVQTFVRFKERPNLVAVFRTESPDSLVVFSFILSILTLIVIGFALYIQNLARKEEVRRLAFIKSALEDLAEDVPPRQFVVDQMPHVLSHWNSVRNTFDQLKRKLERSARDRLIAQTSQMLGHDLRAPLGNFEKLLTISESEFYSMRGTIRESLNRVYAMIEALRNYEMENLIYKSKCLFDLSSGMESVKAKAESRKIVIKAHDTKPLKLDIDKEKVTRSWLNLALNAVAFAKAEVRVDVMIEGRDCLIRVIDDGPGVPDEFLPRLFQRGATHGKHDGTGLGLAYARQIMRGHGGEVSYRREEGMTVFECYLPNVALESEKVETESSENTSQESNRIVFETKQPVVSQVSICFQSTALNQRVYERLSSIAQNAISFTIGLDQKSSIVLTDSEETAEMASEAKVRSILMSSLSDDEIVRRAPIRLGIKG